MANTSDRAALQGIPPERWQAVWSIVDAALELDPATRNAYIRECCAHDDVLRHEVEQFLLACNSVDRSGNVLNAPVHSLLLPLSEDVAHRMASARAQLHRSLATALGARYQLGDTLGAGGMATVYKAFDAETNADVAVKVLHPGQSATLGAERFLREVKITSSLRHPNIIPVLDVGVVDELPYYIMPCVAGQSLKELLARDPQLPVAHVLAIARDVVAALEEAHQHGIVHRDVKPQNILLDGERALVADFGIARALEAAGTDHLTESGALLGTPAYMSPEQAAGEKVIDARSDIYSLACVVFEMLVGEPPFTGTGTSSVLAKHLHAPAPDVRIVRPSLPPGVHDVLARALAKRPADRFASAREFMTALEAAAESPVAGTSHRRWWMLAGLVVVLAAISAALVQWNGRATPLSTQMLDTTRVVLLPLEVEDSSSAKGLDDDLLYESVARWKGISAADRLLVADASRERGAVRSADDAFALARVLEAGRVVRGRVTSRAATRQAFLTLYDVRGGTALQQVSGVVPPDLDGARSAYARLAESMLLRASPASSAVFGSSWSRSLPARQAFSRARAAFEDGRLEAADSSLEAALTFDVGDPSANLWLAQVRAWRGLPVATWSVIATRGANQGDSMSVRERKLARALVALTEREYASACRIYDELARQDARDFAAWYGLGQCRRMDKIVVPDRGAPSGWRFRSSYDSAVTAFMKAFALLPTSLHSYEPDNFERLRDLLALSSALQSGRSEDGNSRFYGRLGMVGNRVVLLADPASVVSSGASPDPEGFARAVAAQRLRFREIAEKWSSAFSSSASAKHAVALALELVGDHRSIDTLRRARQLETRPARRAALAAAEVLLLVKFGVVEQPALLRTATALADSLLTDGSPLLDAGTMATLASLRGRCALTESYSRRSTFPSQEVQRLAPQLAATERALLARAALGCEVPRGAHADFDAAVLRDFKVLPAEERNQLSEGILFRPALLAATWDSTVIERLGDVSTSGLVQAVRYHERHDDTRARSSLAAFASAARETSRPPTPDVVLPAARLFAALGDTTAAIMWLDRALNQVSRYDPDQLTDQATLASLVRAMILRGQIAAHRSDDVTARRWRTAVEVLWAGADAELRRIAEVRMSGLQSP